MMLASSQRPGVPTFVSKQRTQVCFCASDRSYVAFNVLYVHPSPFGKQFPVNPPYPLEITAFESLLHLGISNDLPWGGRGMDIFWNHTICRLNLPV